MKFRRRLLIASGSLLALSLAVFAGFRWMSALPAAIRLLPEGELLVYGNPRLIHLLDSKTSYSPSSDPDYQSFIDQTGIRFERDLDEVAMSMRNPGPEAETSSLWIGRFDVDRLRNYLQKLASTSERYADKTIFAVFHDGRPVRVCILANNEIAVTNTSSAEPIHGMIDKFRNTALAGRGPYLAEHYYRYVPFRSAAWLVYRPSQGGAGQLPEGLSFDFLQNTTGVVSLQYPLWVSRPLSLKAEIFTDSEANAVDVAESAQNFLSLYRSVSQSLGLRGADRDVKKVFDSIQVDQKDNRAILTASIPQAFLKKIASDAQAPSSSGSANKP